MLVIRQQQLDTFADQMRQRFLARLSDYLVKQYPDMDEAGSAAEWHTRLARSLAEAEEYGLEVENDVARFVEMLFINGWDFLKSENSQQLLEILRDQELDGTEKINAVLAKLERNCELDTEAYPDLQS